MNRGMLMDLCRAGYSLREIASMTHRSVKDTKAALRRMVEEPCRNSTECPACPAQTACKTDYARVAVIITPRRGRYSY